MNAIDTLIQQRTQTFADEITVLVKRTLLASLSNTLAGTTARARQRAAAPAVKPQNVIAAIRKFPNGTTSPVLAGAFSIPRKTMSRVLQDLLDAKLVRKTGNKRATRYFAVS